MNPNIEDFFFISQNDHGLLEKVAVGKEKKEYHHMDRETIEIIESHEEDGVKVLLMGSGVHSFDRIFGAKIILSCGSTIATLNCVLPISGSE